MNRWIVSYKATHADAKITRTTATPASFSPAVRAEEERDSERDGSQRIAEVVDQIGEKRHRAGKNEDRDLRASREREHGEADRDSLESLP